MMRFTVLAWMLILLANRCDAQATSPIQLADPTIFLHENVYYLYGTVENDWDAGFKAYSSEDKVNWSDRGVVLNKADAFGTKGYWAPQVFFHNQKFFMAYVANEQIAIAEGASPLGPFKQKLKVPIAAPVRMIDPYVFFDSGKVYLYHVRLDKGNRIYVAEMDNDLSSIKEETVKECINVSKKWENTENVTWGVTEGPTVVKFKDLYYLFYSANDYRNRDYSVGYATSDNPVGPWKKQGKGPILSRTQTGVNGSGHGDIVLTKDGKLDYVFHTHESNLSIGKRKTAIITLKLPDLEEPKAIISVVPGTFRYLNLPAH